MTGPKLNEGATVAGERPGTRATAKYLRVSAYKAREVLDLIRGLDVRRADEVLQFTQRGVATDVRKVLASAVANAVNNDGQEAEELFVLACYADEGPTLRRYRPRARGRATRIRKRTCHITIIVARMSDERLEIIEARQSGAAGSAAASRRARVERSRARAQAAAEAGEGADVADENATAATSTEMDDAAAADDADAVDATAQVADDAEDVRADDADDEVAAADAEPVAAGDFEPGEYEGSMMPAEDGSGPEGYEIKGNAQSMLYHEPGSRYYKATKAEVWFDTAEHAEAAGFSKPGAAKKDDADSGEEND